MSGDPLNEFQRDIAPFRPVWQSACVSGIAAKENGHWISLGLRISLSELPPSQLMIEALLPLRFAYFQGRCSMEDFDRAAEELVDGRYLTIPSNSGSGVSRARIYLNRQTAQALAALDEAAFQQSRTPSVPSGPFWHYYGFRMHGLLPTNLGTRRSGYALFANGERSVDILSYQDQQAVNRTLPAGEPPFDGLDDLTRKLLPGFNRLEVGSEAHFQIVAPLPFFLDRLDPETLTVCAPATTPHGGLSLRFFFGPEGFAPSQRQELRPQSADPAGSEMINWTLAIPWPKGSVTAKACLFFLERQIDFLEINRWVAGPSVRAALDDYFDAGRHKLREGLGLEAQQNARKEEARRLEAAVSRLMSLLGVPLTWYGDWLADHSRPDLGGVVEVKGKKVAILADCTLAKPEQKFSELHKRAEELAVKLGEEAEVIAAVFIPAATTQSEAQRAAEHQIALVGREELAQLLSLIQAPEDPGKVLQLFRQLRAGSIAPNAWLLGLK